MCQISITMGNYIIIIQFMYRILIINQKPIVLPWQNGSVEFLQ